MLANLIIGAVLVVIQSLISVLPNWTLPPEAVSALTTLGTYLHGANDIFPMATLYQIGLIVFGLNALWYSWYVLNWLLRLIKGWL